jgi:hypothetical protein
MSLASPSLIVGYDQRQSSSTNNKIMSLTRIEHPSKRINNDDKNSLDVRRRRDELGNGKLI